MSASSPVSSLSSPPGSEAGGDSDRDQDAVPSSAGGPPAKKRRLAARPQQQSPPHSPTIKIGTGHDALPPPSPSFSLSSDDNEYLAGDQNMPDELALGAEQVRRCVWGNCAAGDLGDQDELVKHVHDVHVPESKATKFMCEWADCKARSKPQGSAYALRAHLRSHTKEKPFYCALPECDRSFTRSDALAKHMRTVHESENLKAFEHQAVKRTMGEGNVGTPMVEGTPQPGQGVFGAAIDSKSFTIPNSKPPKSLKLTFGKQSPRPVTPSEEQFDGPLSPVSPSDREAVFGPFPDELEFSSHELALTRRDLYRLLRRQIRWAEQEGHQLQTEIEETKILHRQEWLNKELVLENVMEAKFAQGSKRHILTDAGSLAVEVGDDVDSRKARGKKLYNDMLDDADGSCKLPMHGEQKPWYREPEFVEKMQQDNQTSLQEVGGPQDGVAATNGIKTDAMDLDATEDEGA